RQRILTFSRAAWSMSFRCLSIIAFLMAGRPASGGFTLLAWMRPQRTTRGMEVAPLREEGPLYRPESGSHRARFQPRQGSQDLTRGSSAWAATALPDAVQCTSRV